MHGEGMLKMGNGEKYIGHFQNGKLNGEAKIYLANGALKFEGKFKDGK
jgi:antitoxin component YwqK of YwqJK toxin-antitoxin module